jgi:hypothetical protein
MGRCSGAGGRMAATQPVDHQRASEHDGPAGSQAGRCAALARPIVFAALGVLLSVAFAGTAQAEQCSPEGKICLVTEATVEHPFESLQTVQVRVASEATSVSMTGGKPVQLIEQGPPGGMSLWQGTLGVFEQDGMSTLSVAARGFPELPDSYEASFPNQPVRAAVVDRFNTIKRIGKRYVITFSFTARVGVKVHQWFSAITCLPSHACPNLSERRQPFEVGPGSYSFSLSLPFRSVQQFCRLECVLIGYGKITIDGYELRDAENDDSAAGALLLKRARPQCLKRVRKLQQQAKQLHNPQLQARSKKLKEHCYWRVMRPEK